VNGDGLSLYVINSATVEVRGGTFNGDMKVERRGTIEFYGCFKREGNQVKGLFASDASELDVNVRTYYGGEVKLISVSGIEWTILLIIFSAAVAATNILFLVFHPSHTVTTQLHRTRV